MTKYGAKKAVVDGIKFDSQMEADYYLTLKEYENMGTIAYFRLQPKFLLQDAFIKRGIKFRKIEYKADFEVVFPDNTVWIVDIKGFETSDFKIKRKLYEKKYPHELKLITKAPKKFGGGWIEVDKLKQLRKEEKRLKKKNGKLK